METETTMDDGVLRGELCLSWIDVHYKPGRRCMERLFSHPGHDIHENSRAVGPMSCILCG